MPLYPSYRANGFYGHRTGYLDHYLVGLVRNMGKVQYVVYGIPGVYSGMLSYVHARLLQVASRENGYEPDIGFISTQSVEILHTHKLKK